MLDTYYREEHASLTPGVLLKIRFLKWELFKDSNLGLIYFIK